MDAPFAAVLVDADGVVQGQSAALPSLRSWSRSVGRYDSRDPLGFVCELLEAEKPALAGRAEWFDQIVAVMRRRGLDASRAPDVIARWAMFARRDDCLDVVRAVAEQGVRCVLATNQTRFRADLMRELGYEQVFDELFFSYELGAHKPDPGYFEAVLAKLGVAGPEAFFVDDNAANVEAARSLGIEAVLHRSDDGADGLRRIFTQAGLL